MKSFCVGKSSRVFFSLSNYFPRDSTRDGLDRYINEDLVCVCVSVRVRVQEWAEAAAAEEEEDEEEVVEKDLIDWLSWWAIG